MKIYSSELESLTDVTTGSNLEVKDGRVRGEAIVAGTGTNGADTLDGFIITGGMHTHILDGQGSSFDPNAGMKAMADRGLINLIRDVVVVGSTLYLSYDSDFDGTDAADRTALRGFSVSLPAAAGGAAGDDDFNETNNRLPVKFTDNLLQDDFTDSLIQQVAGTGGTITEATVYNAQVMTAVTSGNEIVLDNISDNAAFNTQYGAAQGVTILVAGVEVPGSLIMTTATTATFTRTSGTFTDIAEDAAVVVPRAARTYDPRTVVIHGNLQVTGGQTQTNQHQVNFNDSFLVLNTVATNPSADVVGVDGGLLFTGDYTNSSDSFIYSGIRFDQSANDGAGQFQVAHNLNANTGAGTVGTNPDTQNVWVPIALESGGGRKAVVSVASIANGSGTGDAGTAGALTGNYNGVSIADVTGSVTVTVPSRDSGTAVTIAINIESSGVFPIANGDLIVNVYEGNNQIIPEEIAVTATSVTITLPNGYTSASAVKTVIIG